MPVPLFELDDVTVTFDNGHALSHLTLSLPDGALSVVLGPSGSGKSTLLRLCNRLEVPSSGRVRLRGVDVADLHPRELRRRVGMVFQRPTPFPGTVGENLLVADPDASELRCRDLLERVGLPDAFLGREATELSGGEAQRMCLARALAVQPEVLLMDEPTSALDPHSRMAIEHLTTDLVSTGIAVVWVTHDLDQAERLGGCPVVLVAGRRANPAEADAFRRGELGQRDHDTGGPW